MSSSVVSHVVWKKGKEKREREALAFKTSERTEKGR